MLRTREHSPRQVLTRPELGTEVSEAFKGNKRGGKTNAGEEKGFCSSGGTRVPLHIRGAPRFLEKKPRRRENRA